MIKLLKIRNIQSHIKTKLIFSPGVNIILGISQAGKTAIFRAFRKLLTNRPLGLSIKSDLSKGPTSVTVETPNAAIKLVESSKGSKYIVSKNGERKVFRKFGSSVPDLVKNSLSVDLDLSFQDQLHPYSVFESPTDLGKRIDAVVGTEELENWMNKTAKLLSTNKNTLKHIESNVEKEEKQLLQYTGLGKLKTEINRYSSLEEEIVKLKRRIENLSDVWANYVKIKKSIDGLSVFKNFLTSIDGLILDQRKLRRLSDKESILTDCLETISDIRELKIQVSELAIKYGDRLLSKRVCPLCFSKTNKGQMELVIKHMEEVINRV